ncbi:zinc ribbon domain-containing protein [Patescibacteria group bacterium]|nr:zinc ribbon domain-containing protein [Patescibacteria group bacterium]MBP9710339.1 zinc ribbon domain-containing protein [Patescibacteria group bacterium]
MFCSKCGAEAEEKNRFCGKCGNVNAQEAEHDPEKAPVKKPQSMKFFWFLVYVSMPVTAFASIVVVLLFGEILSLVDAVSCILLSFGLRKYRAWGLKMLFAYLPLSWVLSLISFLSGSENETTALRSIFYLIYYPCIFIYFYKRKHLFK